MDVLNSYIIKIAALQEIRWLGTGQIEVGDYTISFSGTENSHNYGSNFAFHKTMTNILRIFNPVSERISMLSLMANPINLSIINGHAPTEMSDDDGKELFYKNVINVYEKIFGKVIKIVLGDLNTKCGEEPQYVPTIEKKVY